MELPPRQPSGREKDAAAVALLTQLRTKLHAKDISIARKAAYSLSWMQEDGLAILTQVLLGDFSRTSKKAAAYGLRSMKGRMKKLALEVLQQGLKQRDRTTRAACVKALSLIKGGTPKKGGPKQGREPGRPNMQEIQKISAAAAESNLKSAPAGGINPDKD